MYITLPVQETSQHRQLVLQSGGYLLQHKALSRVIQNRQLLPSYLLHNPVIQTAKAQHINVQNSSCPVHQHKILLGLHGKLIRYNDQEILLFIRLRPADDILIEKTALPGPGRAEYKFQAHLPAPFSR